LLLELKTCIECTDGWPDKKVMLMSIKNLNLCVCLPFITACMNDPAVVLALHSLLVHSILA